MTDAGDKGAVSPDASSTTSGEAQVVTHAEPVAEPPETAAVIVVDDATAAPASEPTEASRDNPDAPILPEAYSETALLEAVGVSSRQRAASRRRPEDLDAVPAASRTSSDRLAERSASRTVAEPEVRTNRELRGRTEDDEDEDDDDDDDDDAKPRSRRTIVVSAISIFAGLSIAALIFLGRANSARFMITCQPDKIVAEEGRSFPPWGTRTRNGAEWKPVEIPPEAECQQRETEDEVELASWYLAALTDRATVLLTAREVTKVDLAEQQLNQALLLARAPEKKDKRADIERLLGDVGYWRASAKLRDAATALTAAAKQFDAAAAQRPRHVTDASAWANYLRKLVDDLHVGPSGVAKAAFPPMPPTTPDRPTAPAGTALPVESGSGSATGSDAAPVAAPPPDAGVPTGGVLL